MLIKFGKNGRLSVPGEDIMQTPNKLLDDFFIDIDLDEICLFLECKRDELFLLRCGMYYYDESFFKLAAEYLNLCGFKKVREGGRWKTTMNVAVHSGEEQNPVIDGLQFYENCKDKLILSCGTFSPFAKRMYFTIDLIVHKNCSDIASTMYNQIFSGYSLKGKIITPTKEKICLDRKYSFDELILEDEKIKLIKENTLGLLRHKELFEKYNIPFKRGIILEGPPGNGKTLVGKILASLELFTIIWITPKTFRGYTNEIKDLYELGDKLSPSIIFWEDIDLTISNRNISNDPAQLGELLNHLDGLSSYEGIITIATTNAPQILDEAISHRPNRFDLRIQLDNPDYDARIKMLSKFTEDMVLSDAINFELIAEITNDFSGACMKEMILEAKKFAVIDGSMEVNGKVILKKDYIDKSFEKTKKIVEKTRQLGFLNKK
ncbi:MAG: ATP-binding protein [Candidatus Firestonebacteria bacterium]